MPRWLPLTCALIVAHLVPAAALAQRDPLVQEMLERMTRLEQRLAELEKKLEPVSQQVSLEQQRENLKRQARQRMAQDAAKYSEQQIGEAEELYQVANRNWRSPQAVESLKTMLAKYPDLNRTGCALLYLGQMSEGEDRERYLKQAIEQHSDCFYLNGVQVGPYARLLLSQHYLNAQRPAEAAPLLEQIRTQYPDAIDHRGQPLTDELPTMPATAATQPAAQTPATRPVR